MLQQRMFWGLESKTDVLGPMAHYVCLLGLSNASNVQLPKCIYDFTSTAMTRTYTGMGKAGTISLSTPCLLQVDFSGLKGAHPAGDHFN